MFYGLLHLDGTERVGSRWSDEDIIIEALNIGGISLDDIPAKAHLAVCIDTGAQSWGPDDPFSKEGPRSATEAIEYALYEHFDDIDGLEYGSENCVIQVTAVVESKDSLKVYIRHLLAEVEIAPDKEGVRSPVSITGLHDLDAD